MGALWLFIWVDTNIVRATYRASTRYNNTKNSIEEHVFGSSSPRWVSGEQVWLKINRSMGLIYDVALVILFDTLVAILTEWAHFRGLKYAYSCFLTALAQSLENDGVSTRCLAEHVKSSVLRVISLQSCRSCQWLKLHGLMREAIARAFCLAH